MRSGFPGMLSETMTLAPLFSRISLTCEPPFPMMMDASWVTMRQRIWMVAEGGADAPAAPAGPAAVVAESPPAAVASAEVAESGAVPFASGVEAAVSSARDSIFTSPAPAEE